MLAGLPEPYTRGVIEDVFCAIEADTAWHAEYWDLAEEHTPENTNRWIGQWVRRLPGSPKCLASPIRKGPA